MISLPSRLLLAVGAVGVVALAISVGLGLADPARFFRDYLVAYTSIKYSLETVDSLTLAYGLKDNAVYIVFQRGDKIRKFSTKNNEFNLPGEVLEELGLKEVSIQPDL